MKKKAKPGVEVIKLTLDGQEEEARPLVKVLFFYARSLNWQRNRPEPHWNHTLTIWTGPSCRREKHKSPRSKWNARQLQRWPTNRKLEQQASVCRRQHWVTYMLLSLLFLLVLIIGLYRRFKLLRFQLPEPAQLAAGQPNRQVQVTW